VFIPLFISSFHSGENFSVHQSERSERDGLYPIQALIQPLSQRFKYHFESERETNRLDRVSRTQNNVRFIYSLASA
jgi:hypothetical protein